MNTATVKEATLIESHRSYREMLAALETEHGVTLSLGYIGNTYGIIDSPAYIDDRSWSVTITSMPVPRHLTEGRGPWSHRASGNSYPATRSWATHELPTVNELRTFVLSRLVREKDAQDAARRSDPHGYAAVRSAHPEIFAV